MRMEVTIEMIHEQMKLAQQEHAQASAQIDELSKIRLRAEGAILQLEMLRGALLGQPSEPRSTGQL